MASQLEQAYDHCQRVARDHAKNFYYAFRTLPSKRRRAIYAAYAFCRLCDDIADDDTSLEEKRRRFAQTRALLADSFAPGENGVSRNSLPHEFTALRDATETFGIPPVYYEEVIRGVESDLVKNRFESFEELKDYCYRVASVVGLICIEVFGYDDQSAKEYAVDLGLAMQLTNILRDLKEDSVRDRIYIPLDEMARFGYSEDELKRGGHQRFLSGANSVSSGEGAGLLCQLQPAVLAGVGRVQVLRQGPSCRLPRHFGPYRVLWL